MATPESRYTIKITMEMTEDGKEGVMQESVLTWRDLPYGNAVVLEGIMVGAVQQTVDLGLEIAESLGQGPAAKAAKK